MNLMFWNAKYHNVKTVPTLVFLNSWRYFSPDRMISFALYI